MNDAELNDYKYFTTHFYFRTTKWWGVN